MSGFVEVLRKILVLTPAIVIAVVAREYPRYLLYRLFSAHGKTDTKLPGPGVFRRMDPIGLLMFYLFRFGWTRRYPVNYWKLRKQGMHKAIFTALSGSMGNLSLGVLIGLVFYLSGISGYSTELSEGVKGPYALVLSADVMFWSMIVNLNTALFNMLPIPPLDGSTVVTIIAPPQYVNWLVKYELYGIIVLLALSALGIIQMIMYPVTEFVTFLAKVIS